MEGNKEESQRCIELAQKCISEGHREKALKFLKKAEKLYPSKRAKDLIDYVQKLNGATSYESANTANGTREEEPRQKSHASPQARKRASSTHTGSAKPEEASHGSGDERRLEYTQDQVEAVRRVKRCKDYYEILGVNRNCGDSDLKKQYRKLALQFHPDKNKAPGAADAFKAIGNAFAVLSDPEKKKQYDINGNEPQQRHSHASDSYDYTRGFEGDISPEELFNMFFGNAFSSNVYVRRGNRWQHQRHHQQHAQAEAHNESSYGVLLQMMPIIVLVGMSLMSSFFVSDPPYSLVKTAKYLHERKTLQLKLPYYVKDNFMAEYKNNIYRIEMQVEEEHVANLRTSCIRERNYKETMLWKAKNFNDEGLAEKAKSFTTPSCERLAEIYQQKRR